MPQGNPVKTSSVDRISVAISGKIQPEQDSARPAVMQIWMGYAIHSIILVLEISIISH
jgi:hypothetical protein